MFPEISISLSSKNEISSIMTQVQDISNLDNLFSKVRKFRSSKYYWDLLRVCGKFRHLSPFNAMLINLQKPGARWVLRERDWFDKFHRTIKPNAQPLIILVPFGPVDYLFEIGDTESALGLFPDTDNDILRYIEKPFQTKKDVNEKELKRVMERCAYHGISFDMQMNAGVNFGAKIELLDKPRFNKHVPVRKERFMNLEAPYLISVNKSAKRGQQLASIAHELGHLFCGHLIPPVGWQPWPMRLLRHEVEEFEAESVAWLVCDRMNIEPSSVEYLAGYLDKNDTIPHDVSIETIFKAFNSVWDLICPDRRFSYKDGLMYQYNPKCKELMDKLTEKGRLSRGRTRRVF